SAPAVDTWSNAGASDAGSFSTFGASSDFGGDDSDPEF
ncbi:single-stranded DNA-binding protein, partial [Bifidobacterium longum]